MPEPKPKPPEPKTDPDREATVKTIVPGAEPETKPIKKPAA